MFVIAVRFKCNILTFTAVPGNTLTTEGDQSKDPRDLEDLLDFIEGNPNAKCKDAKKAAKKARQKQKKVSIKKTIPKQSFQVIVEIKNLL